MDSVGETLSSVLETVSSVVENVVGQMGQAGVLEHVGQAGAVGQKVVGQTGVVGQACVGQAGVAGQVCVEQAVVVGQACVGQACVGQMGQVGGTGQTVGNWVGHLPLLSEQSKKIDTKIHDRNMWRRNLTRHIIYGMTS